MFGWWGLNHTCMPYYRGCALLNCGMFINLSRNLRNFFSISWTSSSSGDLFSPFLFHCFVVAYFVSFVNFLLFFLVVVVVLFSGLLPGAILSHFSLMLVEKVSWKAATRKKKQMENKVWQWCTEWNECLKKGTKKLLPNEKKKQRTKKNSRIWFTGPILAEATIHDD